MSASVYKLLLHKADNKKYLLLPVVYILINRQIMRIGINGHNRLDGETIGRKKKYK